jgi:hypothetical protein
MSWRFIKIRKVVAFWQPWVLNVDPYPEIEKQMIDW